MKKFINQLILKYSGKEYHYHKIIFKNKIKNKLFRKSNFKYLFILSPPYCGSTLLTEILSISENVSCNNYRGTREGQTLPAVRDVMLIPERSNSDLQFDWEWIKTEWHKYWDPTRPILLEKSPESIFRVPQIIKAFSPILFIILVRNPYAQCESLMRRDGMTAEQAANYAVKCLDFQIKNSNLSCDKIIIKYEDFVARPGMFLTRLKKKLPDLNDINIKNRKFQAHNINNRPMGLTAEFNAEKISKINPDDLSILHNKFRDNIKTISKWGYGLLKEPN